MSSTGRLRIGAEGIPLKFQMVKVSQARAALKSRPASMGITRVGGGSELAASKTTSLLEPAAHDETSASGVLPGEKGAAMADKVLIHQLGLLGSLVGPELLETLDLECVIRIFAPCATRRKIVQASREKSPPHTPHCSPHAYRQHTSIPSVTCFNVPWIPQRQQWPQ